MPRSRENFATYKQTHNPVMSKKKKDVQAQKGHKRDFSKIKCHFFSFKLEMKDVVYHFLSTNSIILQEQKYQLFYCNQQYWSLPSMLIKGCLFNALFLFLK